MMPLSNPPLPDLRGKRVLLSAGESDPIIPAANVRTLATLLQQARADVQLEIQRAGHRLVAADLAIAKHWVVS